MSNNSQAHPLFVPIGSKFLIVYTMMLANIFFFPCNLNNSMKKCQKQHKYCKSFCHSFKFVVSNIQEYFKAEDGNFGEKNKKEQF